MSMFEKTVPAFEEDPNEGKEQKKPSRSRRLVRAAVVAGATLLGSEAPADAQQGEVIDPESSTSEAANAESDIQVLLERIAPEVQTYATELLPALHNALNPEQKTEAIPQSAIARMDAIFSGPLESLRSWNKEMLSEGRHAHLVAYLVQDFRNSDTAQALAEAYTHATEEERREMAEHFRELVGDPVAYQLLFSVDWRPLVFDPRLDPNNTVEVYPSEGRGPEDDVHTIRDHDGRTIHSGTNRYYFADPGAGWHEGNFSYVYNKKGEKVAIVSYFKNAQLNFRLYSTPAQGEGGGEFDFFKNYLGNDLKGLELFYAQHRGEGSGRSNIVESAPLTLEQIEALKGFYRWTR